VKKVKLIEAVKERFQLPEKEAMGLIMRGKVLAGDKPLLKAGLMISPECILRIKDQKKYVSRGAYKLVDALEHFNISVLDKVCADFGSSTGGFTEVLLEKGAKKVYAVDAGTNQLDYRLRINPKVIAMENVKVNGLSAGSFDEKIDFSVMDLSFTSALPSVKKIFFDLKIAKLLALIKPQFEYDRLKEILLLDDDFNGVIKKESDSEKIISYVNEEVLLLGIKVYGIIPSAVRGQKGNQEYLFYMGI